MYDTNLSFHYYWHQHLTEARNLPSVAPSSGHEAVLLQSLSAPQLCPPSLCSCGSALSSSEKSLPLELHVISASSPGLSPAVSAPEDEKTNGSWQLSCIRMRVYAYYLGTSTKLDKTRQQKQCWWHLLQCSMSSPARHLWIKAKDKSWGSSKL